MHFHDACCKIVLVLKWELNVIINNSHIHGECSCLQKYIAAKYQSCVPKVQWPPVQTTNSNHLATCCANHWLDIEGSRVIGQLLGQTINYVPILMPKKALKYPVSQTLAAARWIILERKHCNELYQHTSSNEQHSPAVCVFAGFFFFFCHRSKLLLIPLSHMLNFLSFSHHGEGADVRV